MLGDILKGMRVVDLTQNVAGPFCSQILADMGAEVIKIERPGGGDDTRGWRPPEVDGQSATFLALNRSKRSLGIDIDDPEGQEIVSRLAAGADVFLHSLKPGSAERRGLGEAALRRSNGRLVYAAISAFGQSGPLSPLPGYDPLMQAFTGIMSVTGTEGDPPARVSISLIDLGTGLWTALGIVAALLRRKDDGNGATVEASLLDTGISWMTILAASFMATGKQPARMGSAMAMTAPYELFEGRDGYVFIAAGNDRLFGSVCKALGLSELIHDERFSRNPARVANRAELHRLMENVTTSRTVDAIVADLQAAGAPCSAMNDIGQMLRNEQVTSRGMLHPLPLEGAEQHRVIGLPLRIDGSRGCEPSAPPTLGADTATILAGLGYSDPDITALRAAGAVA